MSMFQMNDRIETLIDVEMPNGDMVLSGANGKVIKSDSDKSGGVMVHIPPFGDVVIHKYDLKLVSHDSQQPAAAQADDGQGETAEQRATKYSMALEHVSTQWVQLHQEISTALRLDFEPNEDIERYTEAIAALRSQVATLTAAYDELNIRYWANHE